MTKIIIIEGIDGSGKTTLIKNLERSLTSRGKTVFTPPTPLSEPSDGLIRGILGSGTVFNEDTFSTHQVSDFEKSDDTITKEILSELFITDKFKALCDGGCIYEAVKNEVDYILLDRFTVSLKIYNGEYMTESVESGIDIMRMMLDRLPCNIFNVFIELPVKTAWSRITSRNGKKEMFDDFWVLKEIANKFEKEIVNRVKRSDLTISDDLDLMVLTQTGTTTYIKEFDIIVDGTLKEYELVSFTEAGLALCDTYIESNTCIIDD